MRSKFIGASLILLPMVGGAQNLSVTPLGSQNPDVLVQDLLGIGLSYSNVAYQGNGSSSGTFTGGNGVIGFPSGVILSNGSAVSVAGPNQLNPRDTCNGLPGDSDLAALVGTTPANTYDATVLQFDFVPNFDTISVRYVFASDEYNQWIGAYNDAFGFFVNGSDIALVPGTSTPVEIDTVNNCVNPSYFIDNSGGQSDATCPVTRPSANLNTTMWGLTTVLTASAAVTPGVTNHIKLAIADVGDCTKDSNVFIQANTFSSGPTATPTITPTPTVTATPTNSPTITPTFPPNTDIFEVSKNLFKPPSESVSIFVAYSDYPGNYSLRIYNSAGEHVRTLADRPAGGPIVDSLLWDGTNKYNDPCASGVYLICLEEPFGRKWKRVLLVR